ncbi:hypothetical protein DFP75_102541 [Marinomonas alcarazii]|uniref:Uncharacterized protein n=1 Tax=Marinomonas alcarazii TaxID=491949 RepID=A0A318VAW1_9GAMM|nr:hypothetical protein [Marinomonas alcarazii]PYF83445.1 hypothetical protein DFP75_102541 [Marinomonas alcarazii]
MINNRDLATRSLSDKDTGLIYDMISMCFDGFFANATLSERVDNTIDKHGFKKLSYLFRRLADRLLSFVGNVLEDSKMMTQEAGHISREYLTALGAATGQSLLSLVMVINERSLKRIEVLLRQLGDKVFANVIADYLVYLRRGLDTVKQWRSNAKVI